MNPLRKSLRIVCRNPSKRRFPAVSARRAARAPQHPLHDAEQKLGDGPLPVWSECSIRAHATILTTFRGLDDNVVMGLGAALICHAHQVRRAARRIPAF